MSANVSTTSSTGRGRAVLLIILVAVLAVVAAVLTVVVSQKTYAPTERTLSPKIQVAAGSDAVDEEAGLAFRVPEGWRIEPGDAMFGSTALVPDAVSPGGAADGVVFIGELTPEMLGVEEVNTEEAAFALANAIGQTLLPFPAQPTDQQLGQISSRVGDGTALSFRVLPLMDPEMLGPEGALIYSAVVGEGDSHFWLTYVGIPADGSMHSPRAEWADEIVERFRSA